jgi:hypothetical protein
MYDVDYMVNNNIYVVSLLIIRSVNNIISPEKKKDIEKILSGFQVCTLQKTSGLASLCMYHVCTIPHFAGNPQDLFRNHTVRFSAGFPVYYDRDFSLYSSVTPSKFRDN